MAQIIVTIVAAVFGCSGFWSWIQTRSMRKCNDAKLLMGIAYSKIIALCESYIEQGCISTTEFHELEHYLYQPYHSMGGNGTVEKMFADVKKLPIKDD